LKNIVGLLQTEWVKKDHFSRKIAEMVSVKKKVLPLPSRSHFVLSFVGVELFPQPHLP
jgi:hypothetical protein